MDINSGFNSGWQAIQAAEHGLRRHAQAVAKAVARRVPGSEDTETAQVQAKPIDEQAQVGTSVVRSTEETLGSLIDEKV